MTQHRTQGDAGDEGYMLVGVVVMVFLLLLALTAAAPRVAMDLKRDREVESAHRANQYVRAIRSYYLQFKHYPGSLEQLEKTNNRRFLRQQYVDPLTGKADWRLIHVGENKTKVKGLFGEDLPGLQAGLGSLAGNASPTTPAGPGFGTTPQPGTTGTPGATTPGATSGAGTGIGSQSVSDLQGTGGPIMGVGSSKSGDAIVVVNEQTTYQDWEFLYDPRIEQLKAKVNLLGGQTAGSGPAPTGGIGSPIPPVPPPPPPP